MATTLITSLLHNDIIGLHGEERELVHKYIVALMAYMNSVSRGYGVHRVSCDIALLHHKPEGSGSAITLRVTSTFWLLILMAQNIKSVVVEL